MSEYSALAEAHATSYPKPLSPRMIAVTHKGSALHLALVCAANDDPHRMFRSSGITLGPNPLPPGPARHSEPLTIAHLVDPVHSRGPRSGALVGGPG